MSKLCEFAVNTYINLYGKIFFFYSKIKEPALTNSCLVETAGLEPVKARILQFSVMIKKLKNMIIEPFLSSGMILQLYSKTEV
jgi:hypothetical protein